MQGAAKDDVLEVTREWGLAVARELGGRVRKHWLVLDGEGKQWVVRRRGGEREESVRWEEEVCRRLWEVGWPVGMEVRREVVDGVVWSQLEFLRGESGKEESGEDRRRRGRLLARLHGWMGTMTDLGQREGFRVADEVMGEELEKAIGVYAGWRPAEGKVLAWHYEKLVGMFGKLDLAGAKTTVIHGDFTGWNLLWAGSRLTGVLDFELCHRNYAVSDFALAWRGCYDEVIEGYEEVRKLEEWERALVVPAYWSWIFSGVVEQVKEMGEGKREVLGMEWEVKQLLRRSKWHSVDGYVG